MLHRSLALAAVALAAGCGDQSKMNMAPVPDMARGPLDHPAHWRIGQATMPVQAAPEVWTVVWPGDEAVGAQIVDFLDWMLHSDYWKTAVGEYGVGAGVSKGLIVLPTAAPAVLDDAMLGALATSLVTSGQVTKNDNTEVAFVPPATTVVTAGSDKSCSVFVGYHSHGTNSADGVAYSVNMRCRGEAGEPIDVLTTTISHEVAEAATDPAPRSGYVDVSPGLQEIGDLCLGQELPIDVPPDAKHGSARRYWVQRQYSDARAADGTLDPCLPLAWDHPYWNVALDPPVSSVGSGPGSVQPISARLDVFAYGDVGLIKWIASSSADVQPSAGEAHAGDTIDIVITPSAQLRAGQAVEVDIFSESEKAGSQLWFSYVQAH
ncbi:MAG: hypothetical protein JWM53_686 [bacterium]|nr:hypothetical protein [bacterium]